MQTVVISGALFFVMILLLLVVYDSNPTVQKMVGRLRPSRAHQASEGQEEVPVSNQEEPITAPSDNPTPLPDENPKEGSRRRLWAIRNPLRRAKTPEYKAFPSEPALEGIGKAPDQPKGETEAHPASMAAQALENTVNGLAGRVAQTETAIEKITHLEGEVAKVAEATEIVSQDFKDILGSVRSSIDGLESRLNQMGSQIQEIKETAGSAPRAETQEKAEVDEETKNKIRRLERAVADITDALKSLPEDVRHALANSREATNLSRETGNRLEVISTNLQSTLGYGIKKTFRCDSCGSQGFVASQVVCSKCGTAGWWGWWPPKEEAAHIENESDESVEADSIVEAVEKELEGPSGKTESTPLKGEQP